MKISFIQNNTQIAKKSIENVVRLLNEDATIPFIARYRKEQTNGLDEVQLAEIIKYKSLFEDLEKRKGTILKAIDEQGQLSDELKRKIEKTTSLSSLEDIYLPYKKKRKTKASIAKEKGLEPLAKTILSQNDQNIDFTASKFISKDVQNEDESLQGARDIIAELINENQLIRNRLRRFFQRKATINSSVVKNKKDSSDAQKYQQYFDWNEHLLKSPSHRLLAILRAEKEGFVKIKVDVDRDDALAIIDNVIVTSNNDSCTNHLFKAGEDAYKRLLHPAISNEILKEAKAIADDKAIEVFSNNLRQLLLSSPLGEKRILALDPGFKSGCKVVCLDETGDLLENLNIYPHEPQKQILQASETIKHLAEKHNIQAIAIGNGTASRETKAFVKKINFKTNVDTFIVNESGASIYSASEIAREEFPDYDITVRGAISIGRRLADPLAELVKIDAKSIGVGQYQHDVDQQKLNLELDRVVASCVNKIGVNVNTASKSLLSYVSGIGNSIAENIVKYRTENQIIKSRSELKKVARLGPKAFEQAAGFLRIRDGKNPLDNSAVHPERYKLVEKIAKDKQVKVKDLIANKSVIQSIDLKNYCSDDVGLPTLKDIMSELEKPGIDPREKATVFEFDSSIKKIEDLTIGKKVPGIINNITNFGCFVDIGLKQSGLVHISKLTNAFVKDPNDVVKLNQHVVATVINVDVQRQRIQLSLID